MENSHAVCGEYCYNHDKNWDFRSLYCATGCCGSVNNRYCCATMSDDAAVGVVTGLIAFVAIVVFVIVAIWKWTDLVSQPDTTAPAAVTLKKALKEFYRRQHSTISLSPLRDDYIAPFADFYVRPRITAVHIQQSFLTRIPIKTPVTSYKELLFTEQNSAYQILHVTAYAGTGKTEFCKRLSLAWSQAHDPKQEWEYTYSKEDISALKHYEYLFFIPITEVDRTLCDVDEIVTDFLKGLKFTEYKETVKDVIAHCRSILNSKHCLIILDGLDEWSHPNRCRARRCIHEIPHIKPRANNTILITSRRRDCNVARLLEHMKDRHIVIENMTTQMSDLLMTNAIKALNHLTGSKKSPDNLTILLNLGKVKFIPYIYLMCIGLWFEGREIGKSKTEIYLNIIEMIVELGTRKVDPDIDFSDNTSSVAESPECFKGRKYSFYHKDLLVKVQKLAFSSLFVSEYNRTLMIDIDLAMKYLNRNELDLCLKGGLLSQKKGYVYFCHKSFHEFFAAFYIYWSSSLTEGSSVLQTVIKVCNTLPSMLEMSEVFIFLSGLAPVQYSRLSEKLIQVAYENKTVLHESFFSTEIYTYGFQDLQMDCIREIEKNGHIVPPLPVHDMKLSEHKKDEESRTLLRKLAQFNAGKMKSLYFGGCESETDATQIFDTINRNNLRSLERLDVHAVLTECDLLQLLEQSSQSLLCLSLHHTTYPNTQFSPCTTELSDRIVDTVIKLSALKALDLSCIIFTHDQLQLVTNFITSRRSMTDVSLVRITCRDHITTWQNQVHIQVCIPLDLSKHENLQNFRLDTVPFSQLNLNTMHLKECVIGNLPTAITTYWLGSLATAHNLRALACGKISSEALLVLSQIIPSLKSLKTLWIDPDRV